MKPLERAAQAAYEHDADVPFQDGRMPPAFLTWESLSDEQRETWVARIDAALRTMTTADVSPHTVLVSEAMAEEGAEILSEASFGDDFRTVVTDVFYAMQEKARLGR